MKAFLPLALFLFGCSPVPSEYFLAKPLAEARNPSCPHTPSFPPGSSVAFCFGGTSYAGRTAHLEYWALVNGERVKAGRTDTVVIPPAPDAKFATLTASAPTTIYARLFLDGHFERELEVTFSK